MSKKTRDYLVTGYSGEAGGLRTHRWIVEARSGEDARRFIRQSSYATAWDGEPIRKFTAMRADRIPSVLLEGVKRA